MFDAVVTSGRWLIVGSLLAATPAMGGWLVAPSVHWQTSGFRPLDSEPTPNYFGLGSKVLVGYSARQVVDLGGFASYTPASLRGEGGSIIGEEAEIITYGAEVGFRIAKSVFVGLRGGVLDHNLLDQKHDDEIEGRYKGNTIGFSLGGFYPISKRDFLQLSLDLATVPEMERTDGTGEYPIRRYDVFGISFSYVFNGFHNFMIENTIFKGFISML